MSKIFAHLDGDEALDLEYVRGEFIVRDKSIAELVAEVKALDEAVVEARGRFERVRGGERHIRSVLL